jgi:hypothetical protein
MDALDVLENAEDLATTTRGCKRPPDEAKTPLVLASRRRLLLQKAELDDKALALVGAATSTPGMERGTAGPKASSAMGAPGLPSPMTS